MTETKTLQNANCKMQIANLHFAICILQFAMPVLVLGAGLASLSADVPATDTAEDEALLKSAKIATDGPALLEFFRKRTLTDADRTKITVCIRQLGDGSFKVREVASKELT